MRSDGAVFAIRADQMAAEDYQRHTDMWSSMRLIGDPQNERLMAQQGLFTRCEKLLGDHGEIAESLGFEVSKYLIPASIKDTLLSELAFVGITAASLFPGLDGLGQSLKEKAQIRASGS